MEIDTTSIRIVDRTVTREARTKRPRRRKRQPGKRAGAGYGVDRIKQSAYLKGCFSGGGDDDKR
eukprot:1182882-Prorocentrum_minimum.AAC.5